MKMLPYARFKIKGNARILMTELSEEKDYDFWYLMNLIESMHRLLWDTYQVERNMKKKKTQ